MLSVIGRMVALGNGAKLLRKVLVLGLLMCVVFPFYGLAEQPKVGFYANITAIEPIMEQFEDFFGIKGEYTRISTSKYLSTVVTEYEAGKLLADVLQAPIPLLEEIKKYGAFAPYSSPVAAVYPDWTKDPDGMVQIFGIEYVAIIYNKELVALEDVPTRYEDLTDPKWYGKIVMPNPAIHATTISWLVGLKENVFASDEEWRSFMEGLAANNPMFVKSFGPSPGPIASGEKLIGISMPKYIITKAPAPLDWARVEQPLLGTPRGIGITSVTTNPSAARLFVDYWLSKPAMQLLAEEVGEYVLYPGVCPPIEGMDEATVLPVRTLSDDEIEYWGGVFKGIFEAP